MALAKVGTISSIAGNDDAMKAIFDNLRNLGIAAVVIGAGQLKYNVARVWWDVALSIMLWSAGAVLFALTFEQAILKLRTVQAPRWQLAVVVVFYALSATELFRVLLSGRLG